MRNWRIPLKIAGGLLVVLGLLIGLVAVVRAISDAQTIVSPFDQVDNTGGSSQGFVPILAPQTEPIGQVAAPALPTPTIGLNGKVQPASAVPTSPPLTLQGPAELEAPLPTATPLPVWIPDRVVIPAIQLDAPVVPATINDIEYQGQTYRQWVAPNSFAAGLLMTSAPLGGAGNTVLIGHHNVEGKVFGHLVDLQVGDLILVYSGDKEFAYVIDLKMILPERGQPMEVRLRNAQWNAPSQDERLTLITCWPYNNNTHRLVIVATPANQDAVDNYRMIPRLTPQSPGGKQIFLPAAGNAVPP
jgi:LPXTG-site transpeptidase (sortase) family protein